MTALTELIKRLERESGPSNHLDAEIALAVGCERCSELREARARHVMQAAE